MSNSWAIWIARENVQTLADLRLAGGVEVAEDGTSVWLRGANSDEQLAAKLAALPASERFEWLPPDQLRRIDRRIPVARLPRAQWQALSSWLRVDPPTAAWPGVSPEPVLPRLVRSDAENEPGLILTKLAELTAFAATAGAVRLARLQFAAGTDGRVIVLGRPLPPVSGHRFVIHAGLAVPAGFAWEPAVSAEVLAQRFGATKDGVVLWNEDGTLTRLHVEQFFPLARGALRATARAVSDLP